MKLQACIEAAITTASGSTAKLKQSQTAYGGCINDSRVITLEDGRQYFLKMHQRAKNLPGLFKGEFEALKLIADSNSIRVPVAVAYDDEFIIMECFQPGSPADDWQEVMGRQLAQLHQATQQERFGFEFDNYIGTSPQPNQWMNDWTAFWRDQRLGWQLELFSRKASPDDPLIKLCEQLLKRLDELLADINEAAVLLHGDLWSGNAASDEQGQPIIFDPASYYGHREAEIGMMRMFGGFGPVCEAAYAEVWPFQQGSEERIALYRLYHEMNHLNLFGQAYYQSCLNMIKTLV